MKIHSEHKRIEYECLFSKIFKKHMYTEYIFNRIDDLVYVMYIKLAKKPRVKSARIEIAKPFDKRAMLQPVAPSKSLECISHVKQLSDNCFREDMATSFGKRVWGTFMRHFGVFDVNGVLTNDTMVLYPDQMEVVHAESFFPPFTLSCLPVGVDAPGETFPIP